MCREQREKRGGPGRVLPLLLHFSRLGSGQRLGLTEGVSTAWLQGLGRTRTVMLTVNDFSQIFAHHVFDQMSARI
jgi:hypothetical protein